MNLGKLLRSLLLGLFFILTDQDHVSSIVVLDGMARNRLVGSQNLLIFEVHVLGQLGGALSGIVAERGASR